MARCINKIKNIFPVSYTHLDVYKRQTVATKTIYGWESGQAQPDADTLLVLCEIYNIDDILGTFGYSNKKQFHITNHERELIEKYRQHPELQEDVYKRQVQVY